jgi:hypothetical protein
MPYLRAALNPRKQPVKVKSEGESESIKLTRASDIKLQLALRQWMLEDDRNSAEELTRLGLA